MSDPNQFQCNGHRAKQTNRGFHGLEAAIAEDYTQWRGVGLSNRQIARHFNLSIKALKQMLKAQGVAWIGGAR